MHELTPGQRKTLRAMAHHLDPLVMIGKHGLTDAVVAATDEALDSHELIKVRFIDQKDEKQTISAQLAERTDSAIAGRIGHIAILYRRHPDPEKRTIDV